VHVTGRRALATLIDGLLFAATYNFLVALFGDFSNPRPWEWHGRLEDPGVNVFYAIGIVAYYVLLEGTIGQTVGKAITGIVVVKEDGSSPIGLWRAFLRTLLRPIDGLLGYAVAFVAALVSSDRQRVGDRAARTLVVRTNASLRQDAWKEER
jgi:uncharacterized RDD family membrane protein YckC